MTDEGERAQLAAEVERLRRRVAELEGEAQARGDSAPFLDSVLQAAPLIIVRVDHNLKIRYLNRYEPGFSPEQHDRPQRLRLRRARDRRAHAYANRAGARDRLDHQLRDARSRSPNGPPLHYQTYVAPVHEADGSVGACLAAINVTEQMRREEDLREVEAKLRLALEGTGLGLWSWNVETDEMIWDDVMRRLHGADPPANTAEYATKVVHPDDLPGVSEAARADAESTANGSRCRIAWCARTERSAGCTASANRCATRAARSSRCSVGCSTSPRSARSKISCGKRRRWRRSATSPPASPTTSTTC